MPPDPIATALRTRPFVPFRLCLADNTSYEIRHPEMMMIGPGYLAVGASSDKQPPFTNGVNIVSLGHVSRLEPMAVAAKGNGSAS